MKKMRLILVGVVTIILQASCVSTQVVSVRSAGANNMPVYLAGTPTPDFTPQMYIEASGGIFTNKKQLLGKLKQRAQREAGINAIINVRFSYQGLWPIVDGVAATTK